ncbi:MAG: response regulator, partial [Deltaproteobacteria bacterium]
MSLVGNLEDLGLGEILQIVSLSRKSGSLSLHSRGREGKIVFRNGQVVSAASTSFQESLGELLVRRGLVDRHCLRKALAIQREGAGTARLGTVLSQRFGISIEIVERVVGEQIEKVVYSLFAWSEGSFDFELQDLPEVVDVTHINPLEFMLEQGLNPQFLALEGTRLIDEMRHGGDRLSTEVSDFSERDSALIEENVDFAFNLLQHPLPEVEIQEIPPEVAQGETTVKETVHDEENRFVLLVDDDAATREAVVRFLESRDFKVSPFAKSEEALIRLDTL